MAFSNELAFFTPEAFGFYLPAILLWLAAALLPYLAVRWGLRRAGFYRLVWHPPLFDLALFVMLLGALMFVVPSIGGAWL